MRLFVGMFTLFFCLCVAAWSQEAAPVAVPDASPATAPAATLDATPITAPAATQDATPISAPAEPAAPQELQSAVEGAAPAEEPAPEPQIPDEPELPLQEIFQELGLLLTPEDEIYIPGPLQGTFIQADKYIQVLPLAKFSYGTREDVSNVLAGYYSLLQDEPVRKFNALFECDPEAGHMVGIAGIPVRPLGPSYLHTGLAPIGFYVQSANFNPDYSLDGETVFTQDAFNARIERFGGNNHKAKVFPYKDLLGERPHWYVICWEFSTNDDFQDIITVVRGVDLLIQHTQIEILGEHADPNPLAPAIPERVDPNAAAALKKDEAK